MSTSELEVRPFVPGSLTGPQADGSARGSGRESATGAHPELAGERARQGGRQSGFVAGYATGYSEGLRRAAETVAVQERARDAAVQHELDRLRAQAGTVLLALRSAALQVQEDNAVDAAAMAELVARCAATLAEQVVLTAAPTPEALLARIRRGIDQTVDATAGGPVVAVSVSVDGLGVLERSGVLVDGLPAGVSVVADPRLGPGDVLVRTGAATVTDLVRPAVAAAVDAFLPATGTAS